MAENYKAWWEGATIKEVINAFQKHPKTVLRQVGVACDMEQAPKRSDQETFPTLPPEEAEKLLG